MLSDVSWETYECLLNDYLERPGIRFTYDDGRLEILERFFRHEESNRTLELLIWVLAEEIELDIEPVGSTTFKREDLRKGFEPDSCFYTRNIAAVKGKSDLDLMIDPPPDIVIEVDITTESLNKLPILAGLGVPEVWYYKDEKVTIYKLEGGAYLEAEHSPTFPILTSEMATQFLEESAEMKSTDWLRRVREWARGQMKLQSPE